MEWIDEWRRRRLYESSMNPNRVFSDRFQGLLAKLCWIENAYRLTQGMYMRCA